MRMGKKLEAATDGRLSVTMFPSMQLGGEKEMIEQAQLGALQTGPHFGRRRRSRGGRRQRVQHAVRFPQRQAHGSGDRRRYRRRIAGEDFGEREDRPDRAVLDECRLAQHLQQQAADQDHGGPEGSQGPHDGQPAVRRHHECARRQRRRAGLRPGVQLDADRRDRRRGKQSAVVHGAEPSSGRQIFHDDRASDHSGAAGFLADFLAKTDAGGSGPDQESRQRKRRPSSACCGTRRRMPRSPR